jgi:SAM-dependent methyltransferase
MTDVEMDQAFWDSFARYDPLWAILSDPSRSGRRWDLRSFLETGRREVSLLMYELRALSIDVRRGAALDFGCGVGRLSQPLAECFDRVVGVDISLEMIRLADEINQHPTRVRYVWNAREDLSVFASGEFDFMYSNVVLQHIEPGKTVRYLVEALRVVGPGGVLVFQLPSHPCPPEEQRPASRPMADGAYCASVHVDAGLPSSVAPGTEIALTASITNTSPLAWSQADSGSIRVGNHWLAASGHAMLIQDDGRASLPSKIASGETCRVTITVTAPRDPGDYVLECDVVHEGISWFADKGAAAWRTFLRVIGEEIRAEATPEKTGPASDDRALSLPEMSSVDAPGALPMHGVHRDAVTRIVAEHGGALVHVEEDDRSRPEWIGYRYFVRKHR